MYAAVSDSPNNKATLKYIKRVDKDSLAIGMTNYIMISSTNSIEKAYYGDVNGDGEINIADATAISQQIVSKLKIENHSRAAGLQNAKFLLPDCFFIIGSVQF